MQRLSLAEIARVHPKEWVALMKFRATRFVACIAAILLVLAAGPSAASLANPTNTVEAGIRKAILEGNTEELRLLLGQAGELSSSDAAIARRALASMEVLGQRGAQRIAGRYGLDWANKVQHALKTTRDGAIKRALLARYGSPERVFERVDQIIGALEGLPEGVRDVEVIVDGLMVVVRLNVAREAVRIATILKW